MFVRRAADVCRLSLPLARAVRYNNTVSTAAQAASTTIGLFDIAFLKSPQSFERAAVEAQRICEDFVRQIENRKRFLFAKTDKISEKQAKAVACEYVNTLHLLDAVSNTLCQVMDAAEACRNVHTNPAFIESAIGSYSKLANYMYSLNAHKPLYEATVEITEAHPDIVALLTPEQRRVAMLLRKEFERDGIHLPEHHKQTLIRLNAAVYQAQQAFMELAPMSDVSVTLPAHVVEEALWGVQKPPQRKEVTIREPHTIHRIIEGTHDQTLRTRLQTAVDQAPGDVVAALHTLQQARTKLAQFVGFDSYTDMMASERMAGSPTNAIDFLVRLSKAIAPCAMREVAELYAASKSQNVDLGDASSVASACRSALKSFAPGDAPYWMARIVAREFANLDELEARAAAAFSLDRIFDVLGAITRSNFGVTLKKEPLGPYTWDTETPTDKLSQCYKFRLVHEKEGDLGTIFVDPFHRPEKFGGAAHFVVRCGKLGNAYDPQLSQALLPGVSQSSDAARYQRPVVLLVTSFSRRGADGRTLVGHEMAPAISLKEVITLFHEFGHALHSLLSRTEFQHVSGTRGPLDFVELPSHVMEYWARDYGTLLGGLRAADAAARKEDVAITADEFQTLIRHSKRFNALELQQSIVLSLFDQALYGNDSIRKYILDQGPGLRSLILDCQLPSSGSFVHGDAEYLIPLETAPSKKGVDRASRTTMATSQDLGELYANIHERYALLPLSPGYSAFAHHSHLASYGGCYYTYLYATALSSHVWASLFKNPASRQSGELWRNEVLSKGASADPKEMLQRILQGPPSLKPLALELNANENAKNFKQMA